MSVSADRSVSSESARELLVGLVETPSPTGDEQECAELLADFFEERGREVWIDEVGNVRAPGDDSVLLTSHIDTVPGDIPVRVENDESNRDNQKENEYVAESNSKESQTLWGRGSVDAKGPLTAMAVSAVETGASFVGVVGEETDSRGARHLIADREAPDAVVNGEPSGWNGVTLGYRGFLAGEYAVETDSAHSSRPEANAIQAAMEWWQSVESALADSTDEKSVFEQVTAKPVAFSGGSADDGLSVEASAKVQFRIPPGETAEEIRETVEAELASGGIDWDEPIPPVMETPRSEVGRAFRRAIRRVGGDPRLLRKTGTSDMNLYAGAWDCPMATYGPGNSELDHAPNEHLDLGEFDRAIAVLETVSEILQE
ncbi:[LysW]-lysine hydrolase [Halorussus lipolyticus]|uniref:[LysW]-lysine hydrolase n=1 Tax=Halorussus lipolyticus TaxID=3034024 RepID=UPI0023E8BB89|nr:[LysW]-lysine hydrolase [Halorussus sp. DT80]